MIFKPSIIPKLFVLFILLLITKVTLASVLLDDKFGQFKGLTNSNVQHILGNRVTVHSSILQSDGKLLLVGSVMKNNNADFALIRYNKHGQLDTSFGNQGIVTTPIGAVDDEAYSVVQQGDNSLVVAGYTRSESFYYDIALVRYHLSNGAIDTRFGKDGNGIVISDINDFNDYAYSINLQGDKLLVTGSSTQIGSGLPSGDFALLRYHSNGVLDTNFGKNESGIATTTIGERTLAQAFSSTIQGKKVIVSGLVTNHLSGSKTIALVRYDASGKKDSTFGVDGVVETGLSNQGATHTVSQLADNKLLVAGMLDNKLTIVCYLQNGERDHSFGSDGSIEFDSIDSIAYSIMEQANGQIVIAGTVKDTEDDRFQLSLIRFNISDGSLDTAFGNNGFVSTPISDYFYGGAGISVLQENNGNIVVSGTSDGDAVIARYLSNGQLDISFDDDGIVSNPVNAKDEAQSIIRQFDGKLVVGGHIFNGKNNDFTLVRYNEDGSLDTGFNGKGVVTTDINNGDDQIHALYSSYQKILAVGSSSGKITLVHYNQDGSIDTSYGENNTGIVTTDIAQENVTITSVVSQQYVGLYVSGYSFSLESGFKIVLARYTHGGKANTDFGDDGVVVMDVAGSAAHSSVPHYGGLVVAGFAANEGNSDFTLTRFNNKGLLDTDFAEGGLAYTDFDGENDTAVSLIKQNDGKFVSIGQSGRKIALVRHLKDGEIDSSFAENGKFKTQFDGTVHSATQQADGNLMVAAEIAGVSSLVRFTKNGHLDTDFGSNGIYQIPHELAKGLGKSAMANHKGTFYLAGSVNHNFNVAKVEVKDPVTFVEHSPQAVSMDEDFTGQFGYPAPLELTLHTLGIGNEDIIWSIESNASYGVAQTQSKGNSGSIEYLPNPDFNGDDSFEVLVTDSDGNTDKMTINVTVNPTNDTPTGRVFVEGAPIEGETLQIIGHELEDKEGLGELSFIWLINDQEVGRGETYTLTSSDIGQTMTLLTSYIDGLGTPEQHRMGTFESIIAFDPEGDYDNDSLSNGDERAMGTKLYLRDTDGDSVVDGIDKFPLDETEAYDSDGDGIGNNSEAGIINLSTETIDVSETEGIFTVDVERTGGDTGEISVDYKLIDRSAKATDDYESHSGTLTFLDGETSKSFDVIIVDDDVYELEEYFSIELNNFKNNQVDDGAIGRWSTLQVRITDDDPTPPVGVIGFEIDKYEVNEKDHYAILDVVRTGGSFGNASVKYHTTDGSAINIENYVTKIGTLHFNDGDIRRKIYVKLVDNDQYEENKHFSVHLTNDGSAEVSSEKTVVTIVNDDPVPVSGKLDFSSATEDIREYYSSLSLTVIRSGGDDGAANIDIESVNGTAVEGVDFELTTTTLSFTDGQTREHFSINIINDSEYKGNRSFTLQLKNPVGIELGNITEISIVILEDDAAPPAGILQFSGAHYQANENGGSVTLTVTRTNGSYGEVSADVISRHYSTTISDYVSINQTIEFADGETSQSFMIDLIDDEDYEGDELFFVDLVNTADNNSVLGFPNIADVKIIDDELPPASGQVQWSGENYQADESAGEVIMTLMRINGSEGAASVDYWVQDASAISGLDHNGSNGTVYFENGQETSTIAIDIIDDNISEVTKDFSVILSNPISTTLGDIQISTVSITDDDSQPVDVPKATAKNNGGGGSLECWFILLIVISFGMRQRYYREFE